MHANIDPVVLAIGISTVCVLVLAVIAAMLSHKMRGDTRVATRKKAPDSNTIIGGTCDVAPFDVSRALQVDGRCYRCGHTNATFGLKVRHEQRDFAVTHSTALIGGDEPTLVNLCKKCQLSLLEEAVKSLRREKK